MHFDEKLCLIIFFDLETTGFNFESCHDGVQICQIAASTYNEDNARNELKFEKYLKPTVPFQIGALKVNGLSMEGFNVILRGKIVKENALPLDSDNLKVNGLSMEEFNGVQICQISSISKM